MGFREEKLKYLNRNFINEILLKHIYTRGKNMVANSKISSFLQKTASLKKNNTNVLSFIMPYHIIFRKVLYSTVNYLHFTIFSSIDNFRAVI